MLRAIIQASSLAIISIDRDAKVTMWNPAARRIFGWREEEVLGRPTPCVAEEMRAEFGMLGAREMRGESRGGLELRHQRKDGALIDVRLWTAPIRDTAGQIVGVLGILEEITARKRAEATLRDNEVQREAVLRSVPVVLYRAKAAGEYDGMWVSENVELFTGFPAARFSETPSFWASRLHPDDREAVLKAYGSLTENSFATMQYRWQCADGSYHWFFDRAHLSRGDDGQAELLGTWVDITERRRTDEKLLRRTAQLEAVRVVSAEVTRELNLVALLDLIHQRAMELVGARGGSLFLWDETARRLVPQVWRGIPDDVGSLALAPGEGVSGVVAQSGEGMIVNDYRASPYAHPRFLGDTTLTAVMAEPLRFRDRLVGVIVVNHQEGGRSFAEEDQQLLRLFADQATIAIENARLFEEAKRRRRESEVMAEISQRITATLDLDSVLQHVTEEARSLVGSDLAQIAVRDELSDTLEFRYRSGSHVDRLDTHRIERGKGVGGRVMLTEQAFRTDDYARDPRISKDYLVSTRAEGVVAEMAVPILLEGRLEGVLFVDNRTPRPFTDRDEQTLQRLADHVAIAIRNAQLHAMAILRAQELDMLNRVALALTTDLDPRDVAQRILEGVRMFFPDAAARLLEHVEGAETLRVVASIGLQQPEFARSSHLRPGEGVAGIAAATRRPVICEDIAQDSRFVNRAWAMTEGFVSSVIFPLLHRNRVIGILSVLLRRRHCFPDDEMHLLQALAAHAAIALENARLFQEAQIGRERLLELTKRVVTAQEEERRRLSRELHDETGQALTALRINLSLMGGDVPSDAAALRQLLGEAVTLTDSVADQVRQMAQGLRPSVLDALGVNSALEGFCRDFGRRSRLAIEYSGENLPLPPETVGIHLYRFLQEALTNVSKHARAHRVRVALDAVDGMIRLVVEDDGVGFDLDAWKNHGSGAGIGLFSMRERIEQLQGRLEIVSRPGRGTRLVARIPTSGGA
jgi:PAS domain S-box-containing protein